MTDLQTRAATPDDLLSAEGKVELIGGRLVEFPMAGDRPGEVAGEIYAMLREFVRRIGRGVARPDGVDFVVRRLPSGRESFRPDASYHLGPRPANRMRFFSGAPTFAVEVRSEHDYGTAAEREFADKRADYFAAGTVAVWDVDPLEEVVRLHRAADSVRPVEFRRGDVAHAEPAVPGWTMKVDDVFGSAE